MTPICDNKNKFGVDFIDIISSPHCNLLRGTHSSHTIQFLREPIKMTDDVLTQTSCVTRYTNVHSMFRILLDAKTHVCVCGFTEVN